MGLLFTIVLIFAVGCNKSDSSAAPTSLKELRLGYFANATHGQAVLGVDSGEFAKAIAPAEIKTKVFNAGPSLIEALFAGEIDVGYVGPGPTLSAHEKSKGQGIRVISGAAADGVVIVARKDSGIETLKDLVGKKIATPQRGNTQDIAARHYLTAVLGQKDHDNILAIANAEQSGMMARGEIDVAWAPEPWGARLVAETGGKIIAEEKDLWPNHDFSLTVLVTTPAFAKEHPDALRKILAVHQQWTRRLNTDLATQLPLLESALFKLTNKQLPPGVLADAIKRVKFTDDPLMETFQTMGQWAYDLQFAQQPPKLDNLFDLTIAKQLRDPSH
ncbi:MAG TPA: ABC transporter substrate-binding protein [Tepidisphaeraceae bacterium]|nr:ABC transporter substrate-binding protein [Tepidisphaeraceae bacterium]